MDAHDLFWELAPRIVEGTIMSGRCLRAGKEFLALVDYKGSGLVVKLPKTRRRVRTLLFHSVLKPDPFPAWTAPAPSRASCPVRWK